MTASCESPVRTYERFTVTYTLLNNLQDFLAVRLVWTPEHAQAGRWLPSLTLSRRRGGKGKQSQRWVTVAAASALNRGGLHGVTVESLERPRGRVILRALTLELGSLVCLTCPSPTS